MSYKMASNPVGDNSQNPNPEDIGFDMKAFADLTIGFIDEEMSKLELREVALEPQRHAQPLNQPMGGLAHSNSPSSSTSHRNFRRNVKIVFQNLEGQEKYLPANQKVLLTFSSVADKNLPSELTNAELILRLPRAVDFEALSTVVQYMHYVRDVATPLYGYMSREGFGQMSLQEAVRIYDAFLALGTKTPRSTQTIHIFVNRWISNHALTLSEVELIWQTFYTSRDAGETQEGIANRLVHELCDKHIGAIESSNEAAHFRKLIYEKEPELGRKISGRRAKIREISRRAVRKRRDDDTCSAQ